MRTRMANLAVTYKHACRYFFAAYADGCTNHSSTCDFKAYAATGDLIYVEPGEKVCLPRSYSGVVESN